MVTTQGTAGPHPTPSAVLEREPGPLFDGPPRRGGRAGAVSVERAVFDAAAPLRARIAARYTHRSIDAAAETDAACWAAIRTGETDLGRLYWTTRSAVARVVRHHTRPPVGLVGGTVTDHADWVITRIDAAVLVGRLPHPPGEVVDLVFKRRRLTATERSRAYRWLARQRRVVQARAS